MSSVTEAVPTKRVILDIEDHPTHTSVEQVKVESLIAPLIQNYIHLREIDPCTPHLQRSQIVDFLLQGLQQLSAAYECLDASRTWVCYWTLHSLDLLEVDVPEHIKASLIIFLKSCQNPSGGFGGGPFQFSHLAPTYAAVNSVVILQRKDAYELIDRKKLYEFLKSCRNKDGAFALHVDGEVDVRGTYCAVAVAKLTNIFDNELFNGTSDWILKCQTYEGGFAGTPNQEAHGGYTFCALAALTLLGKENQCNLKNLLRWASNRQMKFEGGFQGRTNKLVDGCYSFWQGALFPLLQFIFTKSDLHRNVVDEHKWLFDQVALQEYLLVCCQHPLGGLLDKPGRPRDFYHCCYGLSGLSIAQHVNSNLSGSLAVVGASQNELAITHPIYNISITGVVNALQHFNFLPKVS